MCDLSLVKKQDETIAENHFLKFVDTETEIIKIKCKKQSCRVKFLRNKEWFMLCNVMFIKATHIVIKQYVSDP